MTKSKVLGRGIEALIPSENIETNNNNKITNIKLNQIKTNPYQPRKTFNEEKIKELAESIEENGLLQPIIVKKNINGYYLVAGERRFRAFQLLQKNEIPSIIKNFNDEEMMIFGILENLQREDLSSLEEATSYKKLMEATNYKQEELAKKLGKSRPYIANSLRLLKLPLEIKEKLENKEITTAHARTLLSLKTKIEMIEICEKIIKEKMSVRDLEKYITNLTQPKIKKTIQKNIFIQDQENLLKKILGTTVKIKQNKNQKGKIEIEFKNNDEFERIKKIFEN